MSQKGFGTGFLILVVAIVLGLTALFYYFNSIKDNPVKYLDSHAIDTKKVFEERNKTRLKMRNKSANPLAAEGISMSNPASEYCIKVGGTLETKTLGDGGEYSICDFEDNRSCEEWALYRKDCPIGGIKTVGLDTPEEIYCTQIGGKTLAEANSKCALPGGDVCSNEDLYNGKCPKN